MVIVKLRVIAVPNDEYGSTNCVYVHTVEAFRGITYVAVNADGVSAAGGGPGGKKKFVFTLKQDDAIPSGVLAMNLLQRNTCGVKPESIVEIDTSFSPSGAGRSGGDAAQSISFDLGYFSAAKKGGSLGEGAIVEFLHEAFEGQYFSPGQQLLCIFQGVKYTLTVTSVENPASSSAGGATWGRLGDENETSLKIRLLEKSEISWIGGPSSAAAGPAPSAQGVASTPLGKTTTPGAMTSMTTTTTPKTAPAVEDGEESGAGGDRVVVEYVFKVPILGDCGVGKTSLAMRWGRNPPSSSNKKSGRGSSPPQPPSSPSPSSTSSSSAILPLPVSEIDDDAVWVARWDLPENAASSEPPPLPPTMPTIGVDFVSRLVELGRLGDPPSTSATTSTVDKSYARLQFWDTAGAEKYHSVQGSPSGGSKSSSGGGGGLLSSVIYRGAAAAVVVYDVNNVETLKHAAEKWIPGILEHFAYDDVTPPVDDAALHGGTGDPAASYFAATPASHGRRIFVIGNKSDLLGSSTTTKPAGTVSPPPAPGTVTPVMSATSNVAVTAADINKYLLLRFPGIRVLEVPSSSSSSISGGGGGGVSAMQGTNVGKALKVLVGTLMENYFLAAASSSNPTGSDNNRNRQVPAPVGGSKGGAPPMVTVVSGNPVDAAGGGASIADQLRAVDMRAATAAEEEPPKKKCPCCG